jgi:hypothetical protein
MDAEDARDVDRSLRNREFEPTVCTRGAGLELAHEEQGYRTSASKGGVEYMREGSEGIPRIRFTVAPYIHPGTRDLAGCKLWISAAKRGTTGNNARDFDVVRPWDGARVRPEDIPDVVEDVLRSFTSPDETLATKNQDRYREIFEWRRQDEEQDIGVSKAANAEPQDVATEQPRLSIKTQLWNLLAKLRG